MLWKTKTRGKGEERMFERLKERIRKKIEFEKQKRIESKLNPEWLEAMREANADFFASQKDEFAEESDEDGFRERFSSLNDKKKG